VSGAAPKIAIGSPSNYDYFLPNTDIIVVARIDPPVRVKSVTFYSNNAAIPSTTTDPLRTLYHPPSIGSYSLTARAELSTGGTIESPRVRIIVEVPQIHELDQTDSWLRALGKDHVGVVLMHPRTGDSFTTKDDVVITADTESAEGKIERVTFLVDGSAIGERTSPPSECQIVWNPASAGRHVLTARVRDSLGYEDESNRVEVEIRK
jgi:hypothetical protein